MLDFEKASKILKDHFTNLTDEEFITNLKEYCPRVFDENDDLDKTDITKRSNEIEVINGSTSDLK